MRFLGPALGGLAMVYLAAMAGLAVVMVVPVAVGWQPHLVTSGSMEPAFAAGDVVLVAPARRGRFYEPGAVITFRASAGTVTHRVVDTRVVPGGASYATRGDANRVLDSRRVEHSEVIGAVRLVVPLVGRPVSWVRRQQWMPLAVWLATVAAAVSVRDADRRLAGRSTPTPGEAAGAGR